MNKKHFYYSLPVILLLIVVVAGWFATDYLGKQARQEIIGEGRASLLTLSIYVTTILNNIEGAAKSLADDPWIVPVLSSKKVLDFQHVNSVLDRYNGAMNASVTYLMDADGMTVASSNRHDPDSFVGKSYRFRPYFQEAAKGQPYRYFALGTTSGTRGFYASYPVKERLGKVLGVVTMKKELGEIETFFGKYPFCFLLSPEGIIFLSSSPAMLLTSLYPLDKAAREQLIASRQFGNKLSETFFLKKEIADGEEVTLEGKGYCAFRMVINSDGWSIVLLTPTKHIETNRLVGILATISVGFFIMIFSAILYVTDRSNKAIRQAYQLTKSIFEGAPFGIFVVGENGYIEYANINMSRISGIGIEEFKSINVLTLPTYRGQGISEKIAGVLKGGSFFLGPIDYTSYKSGKRTIRNYTGLSFEEAGRKKAIIFVDDITELHTAQKELAEERTTLFTILERAPVGVIVIAEDGRFLFVNPEFSMVTGYTLGDVPNGRTWFEKAYPDPVYSKQVVADWKINKLKEGRGRDTEYKVRCKDGRVKDISFRTTWLGNTRAICILSDVTGQKEAQEALRENEEKFRTLFTESGEAIYIMNRGGGFIDVNKAFLDLFGLTKESLHTFNVKDTYCDQKEQDSLRKELKEKGSVSDFELKLKKVDGAVIDCLVTVTSRKDTNGNITEYRGIVRDVTVKKSAEEIVKYMAYHDSLTGLPNRLLFNDRLDVAMSLSRRKEEKLAVMMIDIDKLKEINDTLGHDFGDMLIRAVADRISSTLRKSDTVARMGGDEFMVLLPEIAHSEDSIAVANKICMAIREPIEASGHTLYVTASVGVSIHPNHAQDTITLLKCADIALYRSKEGGRDRTTLFSKNEKAEGAI